MISRENGAWRNQLVGINIAGEADVGLAALDSLCVAEIRIAVMIAGFEEASGRRDDGTRKNGDEGRLHSEVVGRCKRVGSWRRWGERMEIV